ncbi:MAG TPA: DUF6364 family protein [Pirellulales bacterium]|nr:DUF6364 family protein [Pirellulales bacterium]
MKKLTLSADPEVIEQAKRLADETGTSVSSLFERFIRLLARRHPERRVGRITRQATGMITLPSSKSDRDVLADALTEKYGIKK